MYDRIVAELRIGSDEYTIRREGKGQWNLDYYQVYCNGEAFGEAHETLTKAMDAVLALDTHSTQGANE